MKFIFQAENILIYLCTIVFRSHVNELLFFAEKETIDTLSCQLIADRLKLLALDSQNAVDSVPGASRMWPILSLAELIVLDQVH
jgi:hypothetical protein